MQLTLPDILHASDLQIARGLLVGAPWADGKGSAGSQAAQVKNNNQLPYDCEASQAISAMVFRGLERSALFLTAALPRKIFPPRINRYAGAANHYGNHVDSAIRTLADGQRVRSDISCTVFLSEPGEYVGGELTIGEPGGETGGERRVKLPAGHAVLYPGNSVHQVQPVTRGERLACFFWIESLVRSEEQRRLLFDMDMALMQLRQAYGESAATTALTGSYHNLLRMWAET
ncbi:MAG TPA: Fe2+-dependent dioxygenase [Polaromonas sp.]|uniref:Fe2+-dependent dioxygenase n=1 Tax=Polaromonas sp. TaxID=1869339 RepID=UPI002D32FF7D|nr:Fe2+-dependent dioxygenase [Polaromonas sp.]HYW57743.1 Fe2+-dependent dioxygenase [Polaromonas sp.]